MGDLKGERRELMANTRKLERLRDAGVKRRRSIVSWAWVLLAMIVWDVGLYVWISTLASPRLQALLFLLLAFSAGVTALLGLVAIFEVWGTVGGAARRSHARERRLERRREAIVESVDAAHGLTLAEDASGLKGALSPQEQGGELEVLPRE